MLKALTGRRVECLNQVRPGKICGAHLPEGQTWCPVCGERTATRLVGSGLRRQLPMRVRQSFILPTYSRVS
jgi:hypothetical protein